MVETFGHRPCFIHNPGQICTKMDLFWVFTCAQMMMMVLHSRPDVIIST